MLEILVVPACFVVAALVGYRLGTPAKVSSGLFAVGATHLLAFLGAHQALAASGVTADWIHFGSQVLFLTGFVALVWLAACYPGVAVPPRLMGVAVALGLAGPALAAVSGPTPVVSDNTQTLGPIVHLLPEELADASGAPLMLLAVLALVTFAVRFRRGTPEDRGLMRWPILGFMVVAVLAAVGTALGSRYEQVTTPLFLLGAPIVPLSLAFGPVARRLDTLSAELAGVRANLDRRPARPGTPEQLAMLSPRELSVLEAMAQGHANPVIARNMHLSLSSVEKHATSLFRKLRIEDGPDVHRRVAAVVAYRDAIEASGSTSSDPPDYVET